MQVYLVGGAVRDELLGLSVQDKDFVVVGADFDEMTALGFSQVGADFPVFLHPNTHLEYALARTERKNGTGYQGFATDTRGVTLKDDLLRRDLTINALALEVTSLFDDTPTTGQVIDFYHGLDDLHNKTLRHISPAFSEDPLRILRTVRFFARFYEQGFCIADDTIALMQKMAAQGELNHLSRERLWAESTKAMANGTGHYYWQALKTLKILPYFLYELDECWNDELTFKNTIKHLAKAKDCSIAVQFTLLCSGYLLKNDTEFTKQLIDHTAKQLNTPKYPIQLAYLFYEFYDIFNMPLQAERLINLIEKSKYHQNNMDTLTDLLSAIFIFNENTIINQTTAMQLLSKCKSLYQSVKIYDIDQHLTGKEIGNALSQLRIKKISAFICDLSY